MEASQEGIGNTLLTGAGKMADFLLLNRTDAHFAMKALSKTLDNIQGGTSVSAVTIPARHSIAICTGGVIPNDPVATMADYANWTEAVCSDSWYKGSIDAQRSFCQAIATLSVPRGSDIFINVANKVKALKDSINKARVPQSMPNFNARLMAVRFPMMGGFALEGQDPDLDAYEYLFGAGRAAANWPGLGFGMVPNPERDTTEFPVLTVQQMRTMINDMTRAYKALGVIDKVMGNTARQDLTAAQLDKNIKDTGGIASIVNDADYLFEDEKKTFGFAHYANKGPRSIMASVTAIGDAPYSISYNVKKLPDFLSRGPVRTFKAYYRWILESIQAHGAKVSTESVTIADMVKLPPSARW